MSYNPNFTPLHLQQDEQHNYLTATLDTDYNDLSFLSDLARFCSC